jgi:hypothetical protein
LCDNHCWAMQESTVVKKWVSLLRVSLDIVGTMVCDRISARMMQGETMTPPPTHTALLQQRRRWCGLSVYSDRT